MVVTLHSLDTIDAIYLVDLMTTFAFNLAPPRLLLLSPAEEFGGAEIELYRTSWHRADHTGLYMRYGVTKHMCSELLTMPDYAHALFHDENWRREMAQTIGHIAVWATTTTQDTPQWFTNVVARLELLTPFERRD